MAEKYGMQFCMKGKREWDSWQELDSADVPLRLGTHEVFLFIIDTPQGRKQIKVNAEVTKARF